MNPGINPQTLGLVSPSEGRGRGFESRRVRHDISRHPCVFTGDGKQKPRSDRSGGAFSFPVKFMNRSSLAL